MPYSAPVHPELSRLTSGYGTRPGRTTGAPTYHAGLDFRGARGEPVYAVADGVVEFTADESDRRSRTRGYGNVITIRHPAEGVYSLYAHLHQKYVAQGDAVRGGQLIGQVGNTTNRKFFGMAPHLHFEIRRPTRDGSSPVPGPYRVYNLDPRPWLAERGVEIATRGGIVLDPRRAAMPAMMQPIPGTAGLGARGDGLGQFVDPTIGPADADYNRDFEEPIRDAITFDPISAGALITVAGAGVAAAGSSVWMLSKK